MPPSQLFLSTQLIKCIFIPETQYDFYNLAWIKFLCFHCETVTVQFSMVSYTPILQIWFQCHAFILSVQVLSLCSNYKSIRYLVISYTLEVCTVQQKNLLWYYKEKILHTGDTNSFIVSGQQNVYQENKKKTQTYTNLLPRQTS